MKDIFELFKTVIKITKISIHNFTVADEVLWIEIFVIGEDLCERAITFENVSDININYESYGCSYKSSIIIEDISTAQLEGKTYKILIAENSMTFYCKKIELEL